MFEFKDSVEYKAAEEMKEIFLLLSDCKGKIDNELTDLVLTYDIEEVFKMDYMKSQKKKFYTLVTEKLPNYYQAHLQTKVMGREP